MHSGLGDSYSKALTVNKGEVYYLVLDNVYENGKGHTLIIHLKPTITPIVKKPIDKKLIVKKETVKVVPKKDMRIKAI